jgi:hypothetical protein
MKKDNKYEHRPIVKRMRCEETDLLGGNYPNHAPMVNGMQRCKPQLQRNGINHQSERNTVNVQTSRPNVVFITAGNGVTA